MADRRRNREDPLAVARFGWRYHHLGIPHSSPRDGELHLKKLGVHVCDVVADGQRSLVNDPGENIPNAPITVMLNWWASVEAN